jgi:hypothetical protein
LNFGSGFGEVFKANFRGETIAVKKLNLGLMPEDQVAVFREFRRELWLSRYNKPPQIISCWLTEVVFWQYSAPSHNRVARWILQESVLFADGVYPARKSHAFSPRRTQRRSLASKISHCHQYHRRHRFPPCSESQNYSPRSEKPKHSGKRKVNDEFFLSFSY